MKSLEIPLPYLLYELRVSRLLLQAKPLKSYSRWFRSSSSRSDHPPGHLCTCRIFLALLIESRLPSKTAFRYYRVLDAISRDFSAVYGGLLTFLTIRVLQRQHDRLLIMYYNPSYQSNQATTFQRLILVLSIIKACILYIYFYRKIRISIFNS